MCTNRLYLYVLFFSLSLFSCVREEFRHDERSAKENFNLLWKIVDENYCYFDLKKIDWDSVKAVYARKVNGNMADKELFGIFSSMLCELKDGHVNLYSDFNTSRYWNWFLDYPQNYNPIIVERNYLGDNYIIAGKIIAKNIRNVGYLRYDSFEDIITRTNIVEAINQLGAIKGLIIDIRNNGGGYVKMVDVLASCFFSQKTLVGYTRYKEGARHSDFSRFFPRYVEPDSPSVFDGRIVILTNRLTYSACNEFIAYMKCLPNVTLIGNISGGGGGMPFSSELYNGWRVRISRDPFYDANQHHIENGIEPHIYMNMDKQDEYQNIDSIIEYALDFLQ
jgi:hypothetical protein